MKSALNLSLFLFALFTFIDKSFALTDYEIKRLCNKELRKSICIKNLKDERSNLQKGKPIEIPVRPYKGN